MRRFWGRTAWKTWTRVCEEGQAWGHYCSRKKLRLRLIPRTRADLHPRAGVSAVIATSFARIFFRNAINLALPIVESQEAADKIQDGDELQLDMDSGVVRNLTRNETYGIAPFPPFMQKLINAGGC